ncbi:MAG: phosphoribosylamine--glycine ligase [Gemmatimonadaceae bacterium]
MKVLIVGGGGREHALAWKLKQDLPTLDLIVAPGNPGIATLGRCVPVRAGDVSSLVTLAHEERPDLTVVGPEAPLAAGLVDLLRTEGLAAFGPTRAAAEIESSKAFAKQLMLEAGVPTARAERHTRADEARHALRRFGAPVVIKASGLAAGKGVLVCRSATDAEAAVDAMLLDHSFGAAGAEILVEEYMEGEELSVLALTDGHAVLPMLPAQDHKRLADGDLGPNTGGMGAYAPVSIAEHGLESTVVDTIFLPTLEALRARQRPFSGLLYAGLMLTPVGPRVVEFNCRFGDPEAEALLPLLRSNLLELLMGVARGAHLPSSPLAWSGRAAVTTVVAAEGYPEAPRAGAPLRLPPAEEDLLVFHAGTATSPSGELVAAGGRVLAITGLGDSVADASERSRRGAEGVELPGKQFRRDIGWRELERHARAAGD